MIDTPSFSIIIPTYQRPIELVRCLRAIAKLNYPSDNFEVIIVNDGGEIDEKGISEISKDLVYTLLHQKQSGPASARNCGAKIAKYDFLAFTDDDCEPDSEWLNDFAEQIKVSSEDLIGGTVINGLDSNIYSTSSQLLVSYLYNYGEQSNPDFAFFTTNNIAVSRTKFLSMGGFEKTFDLPAAEDRDFSTRWQEDNNKMVFLKTANIFHYHNLNLKGFWIQHFNYGRGAYHYHELRQKRSNRKTKIEPPKFYMQMFAYPFIKKPIFSAAQISFLFFVAQCANISGYFREYFFGSRQS